jgi:hypothetical protein
MKYREIRPGYPLKQYVKCYYIYESGATEYMGQIFQEIVAGKSFSPLLAG